MIYDDLNKKWVPSGTSHGLSKVHIYHHFINNTFRVVGRKLQDHEVSCFKICVIVFKNHQIMSDFTPKIDTLLASININKKLPNETFKSDFPTMCQTVYMCILSWDLLTPFNDRLFGTQNYLQSYKSGKKKQSLKSA